MTAQQQDASSHGGAVVLRHPAAPPSLPFEPDEAQQALRVAHLGRFLATADEKGQITNEACRHFAGLLGVHRDHMRRLQRWDRILREHLAAVKLEGADTDALRKVNASRMQIGVRRLIAMEAAGHVLAVADRRLHLNHDLKVEYARLGSNAAALADYMRERQVALGRADGRGLSYSNVRAVVRDEIPRYKRAGFSDGARAADRYKVRVVRRTVVRRDRKREYQIDGRKVCEAWLDGELVPVIVVSVVDVESDAVPGLHVGTTEDSQAVALALFDAGVSTPDFPLGGLPLGGVLTFDNGPGETADTISSLCEHLDIEARHIEKFTPNQNGGVESWHSLQERRMDPDMGYRPDAPRARSADSPWRDVSNALPFETVRRRIRTFQYRMTFDRERVVLGRQTSAERFLGDPWGISQLTNQQMIWLLPAIPAVVKGDGVRIGDGHPYNHPALYDKFDEHVEVHYVPLVEDWVYVCHDGKVLCRAERNMTAEQAGELAERSRAMEKQVDEIMREVARSGAEDAERERRIERELRPTEPVAGRDTHKPHTRGGADEKRSGKASRAKRHAGAARRTAPPGNGTAAPKPKADMWDVDESDQRWAS